MSQTGPWNKFSNDQRAREAAREAAMAEGITLGEYLNRLLMTVEDQPQPSETPYSYSRRTGVPPQHTADSATALDRLTRRIEATEARSTLAINGMDHTVHGLVARLQTAEQTTVAVAGHVEGLIDEMRATHEALQSKVRHLESEGTGGRGNVDALKALEGALGKLATHVYEEAELTQNETAAIKGRVEAGFADIGERVEGMEARVDRTLSDAAARVERAVEQAELRAEGAARGLAERMDTIEERLAKTSQSEERLTAVEADVSGALDSMESTLVRIQERLNRAETSTDSALKSLETTFAHLDERIEAVASQVDPELATRLKQEFEQRFEDLARSVRSTVDNARLEMATEITRAAAGQEEKLDERLKAEVGELKSRLADVEAREPADVSGVVQEEIGRLGTQVAERIDALAAHVEDRIEESENRSAEAIEQVGEQVTVAAVRLQKRQDEALSALADDITGMREASEARLSDALAGVSDRLEQIQEQSSESLSPVQRAIVALATRLESLEAFTTPPHVASPPPVLPETFKAEPIATAPQVDPTFDSAPESMIEDEAETMFDTAPAGDSELARAAPADINDADMDFEAGFSGWEVLDTKKPTAPYDSDFDAAEIPEGDTSLAGEPEEDEHNYITDAPADDEAAHAFDPVSELDGYDMLEDSQTETRESDIFDDEPDFTRALAEAAETEAEPVDATTNEHTADYLARARRAALAAASEPAARSKPRAAPVSKYETSTPSKPGGNVKVPMILAASAVLITGAGVGGYLYLRGKQPVAPTLSGPVDTYVDPETGTPASPSTFAAAEDTTPVDAEQMLFEDDTALVADTLFNEAEPEAAGNAQTADAPPADAAPGNDVVVLAEAPAAKPVEPVPVIASVQTPPPSIKPPARLAPLPAPKPVVELTPEQAAIKTIVTAAEAIEASSPPSLKPAMPAVDTRSATASPRGDTSFPPIPEVVTVEAEANAGNAVAQYQYAQVKLADGDLATAASFLRRASQKGIAPAQYELGKLYERGQGVDRDMIEARNLIQKSAEAGHVNAMYDYALFLAEGEGGAKSETDAVTWFQQAADHGLLDAQYNLGVVHAEGIGTPKDLAKALFWFEVAANGGDAGAEQEVSNLRTRVSMTESLDASDAAKKWKAASPNALANGKFGAQRWNTGNPLQVQAVQTALGRLGFGAGTPDGVLGAQTAEAIRDYQKMEGLDVTGTITPELVVHLNARATGSRRS